MHHIVAMKSPITLFSFHLINIVCTLTYSPRSPQQDSYIKYIHTISCNETQDKKTILKRILKGMWVASHTAPRFYVAGPTLQCLSCEVHNSHHLSELFVLCPQIRFQAMTINLECCPGFFISQLHHAKGIDLVHAIGTTPL